MATINKFIDSYNKGDVAAAAATHAAAADLAIIDEVAPHLWRGPQAFQAWSAALDLDAKTQGVTEQIVTTSAPLRQEVNGDRAYVVLPVVLTFRQGGAAMRETAQMTFALQKAAGTWLIHGWAWSGPKPQPVSPAKQ